MDGNKKYIFVNVLQIDYAHCSVAEVCRAGTHFIGDLPFSKQAICISESVSPDAEC